MGLLSKLQQPQIRENIFRCALALGTFAALPYPSESQSQLLKIILICEWGLTGAWAWSLLMNPEMSRTFWTATFIVSILLFLKLKFVLHPLLLILWGLWRQLRDQRLANLRFKKSLIIFVVAGSFFQNVPSRAEDQITDEELKQMEIEMGDLSEIVSPDGAKKKKKKAPPPVAVEVKEASPSKKLPQQKISEKIAEPKKEEPIEEPEVKAPEVIELKEPVIEKLSEKEKVEIPDLTPTEEIPIPVKTKVQKKSNKRGKVDPKKFDNVEDLSNLTRSEKDAVIQSMPKPSDVKEAEEGEKNRDVKLLELPKYLTGYGINDFSSCITYDQIPWKFSPDRRKKRLLMKDKLRHQTETSFKTWEIYQVMDAEGYVSYVFRNALPDGRYDSIVIKDTIYNRFIETPQGKKQTELQDLKGLVNRPALAFYSQDGGTISLIPSAIGRSALVVQQGKSDGRLLPPLFVRGNTCDRPDDDENADQKAKENVLGDRAPAPKK